MFKKYRILQFVLMFSACVLSGGAIADATTIDDAANDSDLIDAGEFEFSLSLGYGKFDFPIANQHPMEFNLLPQFAWYGDRAYFDNGLFGYALSENDDRQWDFILYPNEDGLFFQLSQGPDSPLISALFEPDRIIVLKKPKRKLSFMSGIAYSTNFGSQFFNSKLAFDVSGRHNGWELGLSYGDNQLFKAGDFSIAGELGVTVKSAQLVDYYYMPRQGEITPPEGGFYLDQNSYEWAEVGPYEGKLGWNAYMKLKLNYQLTRHISAIAYFGHFWMSDELADTPLLTDAEYSAVFSGFQYRF